MAGADSTAVLDALPDATALLDQDGAIVWVNHAWRMFTLDNDGSQADTGRGVGYLDVCARATAHGCEDAAAVSDGLRRVLASGLAEFDLEYACSSPTSDRWFLLRITPLTNGSRGAVVSHLDVTRRRLAEEQLARQASHDSLTGLVNRALLEKRLQAALTPGDDRVTRADVGLLFIGLDRVAMVHERYGYSAGDEVLLQAAQRIRSSARNGDIVARLGGDEFVVAALRLDADRLGGLAERIGQALSGTYGIHGDQVRVAASIGRHLAPAGGTAIGALRAADVAMNEARGNPADPPTSLDPQPQRA